MPDEIRFYSTADEYGCFSNFSRHGFELDNLWWPTSEHYFQAQKFAGVPDHVEAVRLARSAKEAAEMGRDRSRPLRADWDNLKDDVMRRAVRRNTCSSLLSSFFSVSPCLRGDSFFWATPLWAAARNRGRRIGLRD